IHTPCRSSPSLVSYVLAQRHLRALLAFPPRRPSDLGQRRCPTQPVPKNASPFHASRRPCYSWDTNTLVCPTGVRVRFPSVYPTIDRKSTRLNSSHVQISYAVFGLNKTRPNSSHARRP